MAAELIITNVFHLVDGVTVIACEGSGNVSSWVGRQAALVADSDVRQKFVIAGERIMLNKNAHKTERAIETRDELSITLEEAQSKAFRLILV